MWRPKAGADRDDLTERLKVPRTGVAGARHALRHANPLAANAGESWCRAQMIEAGFPTPVLQKLHDGSRAEVDHDFDGKVVVEFDGFVKYGSTYLGPGGAPADVVFDEKRREDGLRELGLDVVRAVREDLKKRRMVPVVRRHLIAKGVIAG